MAITRAVAVDDLTPAELATIFTDMSDFQQAKFFAHVWQIAKAWPGAGWCQQSYSIVQRIDADGRNTIAALAAHLVEDAA